MKKPSPIKLCILLILLCNSKISAQVQNFKSYYNGVENLKKKATVQVTFLGTTTLLFDDGESQLLVDAFLSRPSLWNVAFGKIKTDTAVVDSILSQYNISRLKGVFATHSHYDHIMDAEYICKTTGAALYGSLSAQRAAPSVSQRNVYREDQHSEYSLGQFYVSVYPSRHSPPGIFNNDIGRHISQPLHQPVRAKSYKEGGTYTLLIQHGDKKFLVVGSANLGDNALYPEKADVVFLSTAALAKQKKIAREQYYQSMISHTGAQWVIPLHWDNFFRPLSDKPRFLPRIADNQNKAFQELINHTNADGIAFKILLPGKQMRY